MALTIKKKLGRPKDEARAASRREEILDAAAKIFAERGYPNTDVQVVADLLGVGKGTIYRNFPSKRELFLEAADRGMRRLLAQIDSSIASVSDPLERIARAICAYLAFFDINPEFIELLIQERAEFKDRKTPTYFEYRGANVGRWQEFFRSLIAENRVRDIPVERITDVISNLLYGTIFTNFFAGRKKPFEIQAEEILDIVFHGILAGKE